MPTNADIEKLIENVWYSKSKVIAALREKYPKGSEITVKCDCKQSKLRVLDYDGNGYIYTGNRRTSIRKIHYANIEDE